MGYFLCSHSFTQQHLLSSYHVLSSILDTGDKKLIKTKSLTSGILLYEGDKVNECISRFKC